MANEHHRRRRLSPPLVGLDDGGACFSWNPAKHGANFRSCTLSPFLSLSLCQHVFFLSFHDFLDTLKISHCKPLCRLLQIIVSFSHRLPFEAISIRSFPAGYGISSRGAHVILGPRLQRASMWGCRRNLQRQHHSKISCNTLKRFEAPTGALELRLMCVSCFGLRIFQTSGSFCQDFSLPLQTRNSTMKNAEDVALRAHWPGKRLLRHCNMTMPQRLQLGV